VNAPPEPLAVPDDPVLRLRDQVTEPLKARFIERDEVIDLIALALVAGEHLFLYGPPGTAKSALIREFARSVHGRYFEYMLTRFSEPNEIFGPIDLVRLREGVVATVTTHMLPEAEFAFLDELFNANSAILNNLLTVLNERVYRRGAEVHRLPLLSLFSASNHLPEDDALLALFDRFLLRCQVGSLPRASTSRLLAAGWELEFPPHAGTRHPGPVRGDLAAEQPARSGDRIRHFDMPELRALAGRTAGVDLAPTRDLYTEVVSKIRDLGIAFSDRRAVKAQKLIAASAVLCQREEATPADLWVLRYVWDRVEQIGPLRGLIQGILEQHPQPLEQPARPHPQASAAEKADPEVLARQLDAIQKELDGAKGGKAGGRLSLVAIARLREQVARLADRAAWVRDDPARQHLLQRTGQLLQQLG
jgi:MoxR-like ATPase